MRGTHRLSEGELAASFWSHVDRSAGPEGCWVWTGHHSSHGSPVFSIPGLAANRSAMRFAYTLTHGPLPPGRRVWQTCEGSFCVNPAHLGAGPPAEYVQAHPRLKETKGSGV